MEPTELIVAVAIAIVGGGYIGCVIDRWRKRPPSDELPNRWVSEVRMSRMHVIDDEWPGSAVQRDHDD